ncbi:MAG TPA: C25 family cysteine peptidase, partial [Candidatus Edwardsbacteria bacterium]|nr:C25 family cysteine peptidase [Candidatus Edwardsbacteria bacterium]
MALPRLTYAIALLLCAAPSRSQVSLIRSDGSRLVLECGFERPAAVAQAVGGAMYQRYSIAGCANGIAPGAPALPQRGIAFAVPPNTVPVIVSASAAAETTIAGTPLPAPGIAGDSADYRPDRAIYGGKARYPLSIAQLAPTVWAGDRKLASVLLHPMRYDPASGSTTAAGRIRVEIEFRPAAGDRPLPADGNRASSGPAAARLRGLANAGSAATWRCLPATAFRSKSAVSSDTMPYKILISRDGWYTVGYDDLERAGVPAALVDPRTIKLFFQGREVPVYFRGQQDGTFDPGDRFEFYGLRARGGNTFFNQFSDANVYWMTWGGLPGARLAEQDGSPVSGDSARSYPALEHWEQDSVFYRLKSAASDQRDRWFWKRIDSPASFSLPLALADIDLTAGTSARFRIMLHGFTDPGGDPYDHRAIITLNGRTIADTSWTGQTPCLVNATVPLSAFVAGDNLLTLQHGDLPDVPIDSYFLNWIELDYPRSYQAPGGMLDFAKPDSLHDGAYRFAVSGFPTQNIDVFKLGASKITGGRVNVGASGLDYTVTFSDRSLGPAAYVAVIDDSLHKLRPQAIVANAPSDLRDPARQAEYLIIAPEALAAQARQLAAERAAAFQGAMVALTTDIYDEFGQGLASDQAIKDFISYAYFNYQVPPQYVLLLGGGSYDPRNLLGTSKQDYVPVHLSRTDDFGPVPDDDYYARVVGDDFMPDLAVGRLTVNSLADYQGWEAKRAGYERTPFTDQWHRDFLMIAGYMNYSYEYDTIFSGPTNKLCATLSPRFEVSKVYHRNPNTTADLIDQFNEGAIVAAYYGHGGGQVWGHSSFFTNAEAEGLNNIGRWPLTGGFTCYSGAIDIPDTLSLAQQLMRVPGGAIGVYASSGPSWDNWIEQTFIGAINQRMLRRFGDIITSAELDLYAAYGGDSTEVAAQMMRSYNLLGDPGMRLALPD